MEELLSLKWNNHKSTFIQILTVLREKHVYTDVTLACDGKFYSVHKLVLSTCSDYFSAMLERTNCKNPVIVLKDIKSEDLEALLDYMYLGEVNVKQSDLATLIKAAECLRVKGLAVPDDEPLSSNNKKSARDNISRRSDTSSSPPPKRKRRSDFDDGRDDVKYNHISSNKPKNFPVQDSSQLNKSSSSVINSCEGIVDEGKTDNKFNTSQSKANIESDNDITEIEPLHKVKVEVENNDSGQMDNNDSFSINNEDFKEENDLNSDLPEFLQDATHDYPHSSFAGPSFQPDMTWPDGGDSSQGAGLSTFSPPSSLSFANISQQDGSLQHGVTRPSDSGDNNPSSEFPATSSEFPAPSSEFPAPPSELLVPSSELPVPPSEWSATPTVFPNTSSLFPTNPSVFPTTSAFPTTSNAFPTTSNAFPTTSNAFPASSNAFPAASPAFPVTSSAFPTISNAFPAGSSDYSNIKHEFTTSSEILDNLKLQNSSSDGFNESFNEPPTIMQLTCPLCCKLFKGVYCKYNLKKHLTIHAGIKPFLCKLCLKTFNQKIAKKKHMMSIHGVVDRDEET